MISEKRTAFRVAAKLKGQKNAVFIVPIKAGDAGMSHQVWISVHYEQVGNFVFVSDSMSEGGPYDNPPESWYDKIGEAIRDYFWRMDQSNEVFFENP